MEAAHFPKEPAHTGLAILDRLPKKKKNTLKVPKLTSCMNFRMIQAVIKCFERSTVERIEENSNELSRCLLRSSKNAFIMQSKSTFLEFLRGIHRYKFGHPKKFFRGEIIQDE